MDRIFILKKSENVEFYFTSFSNIFKDFSGQLILKDQQQDLDLKILENSDVVFIEFPLSLNADLWLKNLDTEKNYLIYLLVDPGSLNDTEKLKLKNLYNQHKLVKDWIDISLELEFHSKFFYSVFKKIKPRQEKTNKYIK